MQSRVLAELEELEGSGPEIGRALAPHSIYTVSEGLLRWTAELAAEKGLPVQIHLSETEQEVEDCLAAHGERPAPYLDRLGLLGERTMLAHGVWLDRDELELIAERGATVVTNPVANMKLASGGPFPYPVAREAGVAVALGTDGAGSNDSLDLLSDLKIFALMQRHAAADPTICRRRGARGRNRGPGPDPRRGRPLTVGAPADFLLLRSDASEIGLGDLASDIVYAASGSVVDTTVVAGRPLMRDGRIDGAEETIDRARERAARLGIG